MVIDKSGILNILRKNEEELLSHINEDSIYITTSVNDFNIEQQVGNDSIDLRINDHGYKLNNDYEYINTLSNEDFSKYFTEVNLDSKNGYDLKPGELLFIDTLERIHLNGNLIGRITGRSVFSRFGLSVHCTQDKFSSGINSIVALQIVNNSNTTLKIFPYQKLAQLIIERTESVNTPYKNSTFSEEKEYTLPIIKDSDKFQYSDRMIQHINNLHPKKKSILKKKPSSGKAMVLYQSIVFFILTTLIAIFTSQNLIWATVIIGVVYVLFAIIFYNITKSLDND